MFLFESDALFLHSDSLLDNRQGIESSNSRTNFLELSLCMQLFMHRGDGLSYDRGVVGSQRGTLQHVRALGSFVR